MVPRLVIGLLANIFVLTSASIIPRYQNYGIVGGKTAKITDFPHQVFFKLKDEDGAVCGGSIISDRHILTAGHCFKLYDWKSLEVGLGTANVESDVQIFEIANLHTHKNLTINPIIQNDIAVVVLTRSIKFSDKVKSIALAKPGYEVNDGTELVATGWGTTEHSDRVTTLRKVSVPKLSWEECFQDYGDFITNTNICAGEPGKDSCTYDSGGPLVQKTSGEMLQVGITSWGYKCAQPGYPGVYTDVSKYYNWIENIKAVDLKSNSNNQWDN